MQQRPHRQLDGVRGFDGVVFFVAVTGFFVVAVALAVAVAGFFAAVLAFFAVALCAATLAVDCTGPLFATALVFFVRT